jgi:hypothetical protein
MTGFAILGPFFFPWGYALALAALASCFFPPAFLAVGVLLDILYYTGHTLPYFTIIGVIGGGIFTFVHQFLKARIMS